MVTAVRDRPVRKQHTFVRSIIEHSVSEDDGVDGARLRRFSLGEFQRLIEIGFFEEDERLELLDGLLVEMSPINPRHANCIDKLARQINRLLSEYAWIRVQSPITLEASSSQPQPDLVVARLTPEEYDERHPNAQEVLLLIEVADTSLHNDQGDKLQLYAVAGISEYWICNLVDNQLEVYREPFVSTSGEGRYRVTLTFSRNQTVAPLAFPDSLIELAQILPNVG